ncbi:MULTISPECIES: hypothetical protein [Microbacterium]|uniref:hypothetical protein n=1 Tax=Microbacterium TaxID=33882 RepID=UPI00217DE69C|nr:MULTISPECIES: hypothetical protein [Microbacterium]UWF78771.1 hypothetical protein JSY13_07680 [Microbacterium neungamense]WCM56936.1 hypothetical protein JRG78_07680 [Microbacterium sp. EF45047]
MRKTRATVLCASAIVLGMLTACTPAPEPTPTETALFASEEEAFAAAEETYREYTDALNAVDLSDPETFEPLYRWMSGDAEASAKEMLTSFHADGYTTSGETLVVSFEPTGADLKRDRVSANVCVDVSNVDVVDSHGASVVPPDRKDIQALVVEFVVAETPTGLSIDSSKGDGSVVCQQ